MNQFFEAFANMFRIPDLRKRLLFTLAMLAVYRLGAFLPTPGINTDVLAQFFSQNQGSVLGVIDLFSGGNFRRLTIFRAGHHAVHYGVDHPATDAGGLALPRAPAKRRRTRAAKDHAIHALPDDPAQRGAIAFDRGHLGKDRRPEQSAAGLQPGHRVRADDHPDADHRLGVHHVAWRADYRARRRQRHVLDHLCRNRGRPSASRGGHVR